MSMLKNIFFLVFILFLNSCGNYKPNKLADGQCDKLIYNYPPDPDRERSEYEIKYCDD